MQEAIHHLSRTDPVLARIIEQVGAYRIEFREPGFETLVKAIVYQQLSGRVASVIFARLASAAGQPLTPAGVLKLRPARMRDECCEDAPQRVLPDMSKLKSRAG